MSSITLCQFSSPSTGTDVGRPGDCGDNSQLGGVLPAIPMNPEAGRGERRRVAKAASARRARGGTGVSVLSLSRQWVDCRPRQHCRIRAPAYPETRIESVRPGGVFHLSAADGVQDQSRPFGKNGRELKVRLVRRAILQRHMRELFELLRYGGVSPLWENLEGQAPQF
jgi:hypothetical protein